MSENQPETYVVVAEDYRGMTPTWKPQPAGEGGASTFDDVVADATRRVRESNLPLEVIEVQVIRRTVVAAAVTATPVVGPETPS